MIRRIDLNADLGEGYGPWRMGDDAALLDLVSSANVACGFHAGDPDVMAQTMAAAVAYGVGIGAHPGFADRQNFGRVRMTLPPESIANAIRYQVGAAQAMAEAAGGVLGHLKLHGALANMAAEDAGLARLCFQAALSVAPQIVILAIAGSAQIAAAQDLGCRLAHEIYADRGYDETGALLGRGLPGALIHDPAEAAERVVGMLRAGAIITASGRHLPAQIDSVCLHGDTPQAVAMARAVRAALDAEGISVAPLSKRAQ